MNTEKDTSNKNNKTECLDQSLIETDALMLYWYNVAPHLIVRQLFPQAVEFYIEEKVAAYRLGLCAFWGILDWQHRERLLQAAQERYLAEAQRKVIAWRLTTHDQSHADQI